MCYVCFRVHTTLDGCVSKHISTDIKFLVLKRVTKNINMRGYEHHVFSYTMQMCDVHVLVHTCTFLKNSIMHVGSFIFQ